jgi:hypothetical protein
MHPLSPKPPAPASIDCLPRKENAARFSRGVGFY